MVISHQKIDFAGKSLVEKVTIRAPFRMSVDFPDEACFIYFEHGNAKINSAFEQTTISSQESVLLKCGRYFSDFLEYPTSDLYEVLVIHLPKHILKEIYKHEFPSFAKKEHVSGHLFSKIQAQALVKEFIKSLNFYFENPVLVSDELLALKIKELVLLLMQTQNAPSLTHLFKQLFTPQQIDIQEVVNAHLFSNLSIEDLALLCHMSLSTFKRQFNQRFRETPANYIKSKRLKRAKELLTLTEMTISEIAFTTCFSDVAHFSNSFKLVYDCSPTQYKTSSAKREQ